MTVVSVHIADVGLPKSLGVIRQPRPASIPGLLQANAGIGAKFGTTPARPSPGRVGLIAFWQDEVALKQFEATHPLAAKLDGGLAVAARPLRIHGAWPGIGDDVPTKRNVEYDGPVLVLTLAKTKFSRFIPFFRASQPAEKAVVVRSCARHSFRRCHCGRAAMRPWTTRSAAIRRDTPRRSPQVA
jgi:hypothetical protein